MPGHQNQPTNKRAQRAAAAARQGRQPRTVKVTGRKGQDERDASALRVSRIHSRNTDQS